MIRQIKILKGCKILNRDANTIDTNIKLLAIIHDDNTIEYLDMLNKVNMVNINVLDYKREIELYTDSQLCSQWL